MKFYKVLARPTLLYGSEIWVTAKRDMARLEAAEMRFLRSVTGYTRLDKIRSEVIRKELEISGIQAGARCLWQMQSLLVTIYQILLNLINLLTSQTCEDYIRLTDLRD